MGALLLRNWRAQCSKVLGRAWTLWRLFTLADRLRPPEEAQSEQPTLRVSVRNEALRASQVDGMDYVEDADAGSTAPPSQPKDQKKMMAPLLKWGLLRKMRLQRAFLHWKGEVIQSILQSTLVANHSFVNRLVRRQALTVLNTLGVRLQKNEVAIFFRSPANWKNLLDYAEIVHPIFVSATYVYISLTPTCVTSRSVSMSLAQALEIIHALRQCGARSASAAPRASTTEDATDPHLALAPRNQEPVFHALETLREGPAHSQAWVAGADTQCGQNSAAASAARWVETVACILQTETT